MSELKPYIVCCNGASRKIRAEAEREKTFEHTKGHPQKNVEINLKKFTTSVYRISERIEDLLEIAGYIFAMDRSTYRGQKDDVEYHSWERSFEVSIRVREAEFWNQDEIKSILNKMLCFITGDREYKFDFQKKESEFPADIFDNDNFELSEKKKLSVVLFSGGLDSLAGVIERLNTTDDEICLVSHQSGQPGIKKVQRELAEEVMKLYPDRCKHYKFHCGLTNEHSRDETQRTRSFLYTAMAFAIAHTYEQDKIYVYENGITSINFPETQDLMNGRSSRTTHPKTLHLLTEFFSLVAGKRFTIEHPFLFNTKTDVVKKLIQYERTDLIQKSVSCSSTRNFTKKRAHCGRCTQCVDRRFAMFAAKADKYDNRKIYSFNFLKADIDDETAKIITEYIRLAESFKKENENSFYLNRMNELAEVEEYIEGTTEEERVNRIFELCVQHSKCIEKALSRMWSKHDKPLDKIRPNSFTALLLSIRDFQKLFGTGGMGKIERLKDEEIKKLKDEKIERLPAKKPTSMDEYVKHYIQTCRKMKIASPTTDQLFDCTGIPKSNWYSTLKKSTYWHLLKDIVDHSINQAKIPEKRDFWIKVKVIADKKYTDLMVKELGGKERYIDEMATDERRSFDDY